MMRRYSYLSFTIIMLLMLTVIFTSCDNGELSAETTLPEITETEAPHVHEWSAWEETVMHTCTEDGVRERSCACGKKESEAVAAPGHKEGSWVIDVPNTCTEKGSRHLECYVCGFSMMTDELGPMNHYDSQWITESEPTCSDAGVKKQICNLCFETVSIQYTPSNGHKRGDTVLEIEPTCTEAGREAAYCLVCNKQVYTKPLSPNGHTPSEWITEKEPTVTLDGSGYKACTVCNERLETTVLYSTGTPGLEYTLAHTGVFYQLTGLGTCTESEIVIANGIGDKPVNGVYINSENRYKFDGITGITLGDNMTDYGLKHFRYLQSIKVRDTNTKYYCVDNCLIDREKKLLVFGCAGSIIPSDGSVTEIDHGAFSNNCALKEIVIPEGVLEIGSNAFGSCENLKTVVLPKSVTRIYEHAFISCKSLENINIEDTSLKYLEYYVFKGCSSLKKISIPASVERLSSGAFYLCPNLTDVTIDSKNKTFYMSGNCIINRETKTLVRGFTNSVIPTDGSVEIIEYSAFTGCDIVEAVIPDCVKEVQTGAFGNCTKLRKVTLPKGLTVIDTALKASSNCMRLKRSRYPRASLNWGGWRSTIARV